MTSAMIRIQQKKIFFHMMVGVWCAWNFFGNHLWAVDPSPSYDDPCERIAAEGENRGPGKLVIVSSGRDGDTLPIYQEEFRALSEAAHRLGVSVPPHRAELVPSGQLTTLAAVGHYAIPHWYEGGQIVRAAQTVGSVLEFVHQGCPTCRSFFQDTLPPVNQRTIFIHVLGHNDFGVYSGVSRQRPDVDPMAHSLKLAEWVSMLYRDVDHDQVSLWYQLMLSLKDLQDYGYGTFEDPATFVRDDGFRPVQHVVERTVLGDPVEQRSPYPSLIHPRRPTPSILQFLVRNLPSSAAPWKREMMALFELMNRQYGAYSQTKIMNEGWAKFMEWFLMRYTPFTTSKDLMAAGQMLEISGWDDLGNPYWLGFECWKNLYRRFLDRDDIQKLSSNEARDKAFVAYAHGIMDTDTDFDFIFRALDEYWIRKMNLYLEREVQGNEYDYTLPHVPGTNVQKIILTRDPKRIIRWIARHVADRSRIFPMIHLVNDHGLGRGVVVLEHKVNERVPLKFRLAVKTIFVLSRIFDKPVSLRTVASSSWIWRRWPPILPIRVMSPFWLDPRSLEFFDIRIEVSTDGVVKVVSVEEDKGGKIIERENDWLTDIAQKALDAYRLDLEASGNRELAERERERFLPEVRVSQIVDVQTDPAMGLLHHGPTTAEAILEYQKMLRDRLDRAIQAALKGKIPIRRGKSGVRLRALPQIPEFQLDFKVAEMLEEEEPPVPPDSPYVLSAVQVKDRNTDLDQGDGRPGDKKWGKKKKKKPGRGNGDDEEDDSDDGDEDDPDRPDDFDGPPEDPTYIEIPWDMWAELLNEEFELPNTRRLAGKSEELDTFRVGSRRHPRGHVLWDRTIPEALIHSMAERAADGRPLVEDVAQQLVEGAKHLAPEDYRVSSEATTPNPNIKAVMVFVIDMTGSMFGLPQAVETELVMNLKLLLSKKYKECEFRFVGYDDVAHEFSEEEVLKRTLGGGNTDSTGYILAKEILDKYPDSIWDKFVVGMGDGGSFDTEPTVRAMKILTDVTRYLAWFHVDIYHWNPDIDFVQAIRKLAEESQWLGVSHVSGRNDVLRALQDLFGKNREKSK